MKLQLFGVAMLVVIAGCDPVAPDFGKTLRYEFSTKYIEQRTLAPGLVLGDSCFRPVRVDGSLTFKVNQVGVTFVDADGRLDLTQSRPPLDSNVPCDGIPLTFQVTGMQSKVTGSPDDITFVVEQTGTASNKPPLAPTQYTRRYTYTGTMTDTSGVGILTYELIGNGPGIATTNTIRVGISLHPIVPQKVEPAGKG